MENLYFRDSNTYKDAWSAFQIPSQKVIDLARPSQRSLFMGHQTN